MNLILHLVNKSYGLFMFIITLLFLLLFKTLLYFVLRPFVYDAITVYQFHMWDICLLLMFGIGALIELKYHKASIIIFMISYLLSPITIYVSTKGTSWLWLSNVDHYGTIFSSLCSLLYGSYLLLGCMILYKAKKYYSSGAH